MTGFKTSDRDVDGAIRSWLHEDRHEDASRLAGAVLDQVETIPQRRATWWPARRTNSMNTYAKLIAVAAAVLVVAIVGYQFLPGGSRFGATNATPPPSPALLARGSFVTSDGAVELEATGEGSSVTGRMTVSVEIDAGPRRGELDYAFTVDLQCARTTAVVSVAGERAEDGLIMIGGVVTDSTSRHVSPEGSWAAIVLKRGSPVEASIWTQRGGPTSEAASCLAYFDEQLMEEPSRNTDGDWLSPIEGTVEFGP